MGQIEQVRNDAKGHGDLRCRRVVKQATLKVLVLPAVLDDHDGLDGT